MAVTCPACGADPQTVQAAIAEAEAAAEAARRITSAERRARFERRARYMSPCPPGYDTVLGYMAKRCPEALAGGVLDAPGDTARDDFWLRRRCRERGLVIHKVPAPEVLQEQGIAQVSAYPKRLLRERMGL